LISVAAIMPHAPASGKARAGVRQPCDRLALSAFSARRNVAAPRSGRPASGGENML
jgi:hypothetical protein